MMPAEIFPTQVRTTCHGFAAAAGKAGALVAAVGFPFVTSEVTLFLLSGYAALIASVITFVTLPEPTQLDLQEVDTQWHLTRMGRRGEYRGPALYPQFLSWYERQKLYSSFAAAGGGGTTTTIADDHYNHAMDDF
jgi:hypothetical protein